MKCVLAYPPLSDPTCGYLSLPYLASAVRAERPDFDVTIVDANIEALHFCSTEEHIAGLQRLAGEKLECLERRQTWSKDDFLLYRDCIAGKQITGRSVNDAIAVMQSQTRFWDYGEYYSAALTIKRWLQLLASQGKPGMFADFPLSKDGSVNLCNLAALASEPVLSTFGAPFARYFREAFVPRLRDEAADVLGVGVTYHEQLPFALFLAREVKRALPSVRIVLGGTDISQIWKSSRATRSFLQLFDFADAIVIGDGEHALISILDAYAAGREPEGHGILTRNYPDGRAGWSPVYENVDALPAPSFEDLPWDLYFSPERFVYYAPTRGCYWDRCTFCDYGLAGDRPTAPWRQRSLARVTEDLRAISRESRFVYFSADVIAPSYLVKVAEALLEARIDIRWGAELRLERYFDERQCGILRRSGCVAVSVGFESGNQRILDLMDKGTKTDQIARVVRDFSTAGIGVQIMGFTGFPTETYEEAMDSIRLLEELREHWVFGGLGEFQLTAGAIVARQPQRFGLVSVSTRPADDLHAFLDFREQIPSKTEEQMRDIERRAIQMRHPFELERPFACGTDTAHSYFYLSRYGKETRAQLDLAVGTDCEDSILTLRGVSMPNAPQAVFAWVNSGAEASQSGVNGCILATDDGRLLWFSDTVGQLAPLLDGRYTFQEVVSIAEHKLGLAPLRTDLHLRHLKSCGLLWFHRYDGPLEPLTAVPALGAILVT